MLYQSGEVETENKVSAPGKAIVSAALGEKNAGTELIFGHDLHVKGHPDKHVNGPVAFGKQVGFLNKGERSIALIDLADFNSDGSLKYHTPSNDRFDPRSMNIGRTFEHEFFGHGENSHPGGNFKESFLNVPYVNKHFRSPANISERYRYTFSFSNRSSLRVNSATFKQAFKKRKRIRYDK